MQNDFRYDSSHWTTNETCNVQDGLEGLAEKQTKLASYWNIPLKKLCVGMKVKNVTKWIEVKYNASSLFDVISNGTFKPTEAGKYKWKSLIDNSSLQTDCNKEGFDFKKIRNSGSKYMKIRIGLVANNEDHCDSPDSCIGFGISVRSNDNIKSTSCGNLVVGDSVEEKDVAAFGFLLIK